MKVLHLELAIIASCDIAWHDFIVFVSPGDVFIESELMLPVELELGVGLIVPEVPVSPVVGGGVMAPGLVLGA